MSKWIILFYLTEHGLGGEKYKKLFHCVINKHKVDFIFFNGKCICNSTHLFSSYYKTQFYFLLPLRKFVYLIWTDPSKPYVQGISVFPFR